ncbi:hypothetical protein MJ904_19905 [Massilia sp. MB5]|uniref:hypothetical protein n=1 Tax=unclassified Massilia TaxID=2609279 RepID=UPI00067C1D07|nr:MULTISPECIES: hypothetical protein [unclassified Massilia]AKU21097.1 hypothetical protein ACZ75_05960 [Massilia sp. NR 4-1]UMR29320.1 hypothetical protein MJ904_19905 [Massilia sp. MB5]
MKTPLVSLIAELGWINAGLYAFDRLLRPLHWRLRRYYFVAQSLDGPPLCLRRGQSIEVRQLDRLDAIPPGYPRRRTELQRRFGQGACSLAAFRGLELVGFLWYLPGAYREDEVRVRYSLPSARAVWDFDVYVRPEDRLSPVFARLWDSARQQLSGQGKRWTCSRICAFNAASLRAHRRIGARCMGSAIFLCCGRWQWMLASRAPWFHLSRCEHSAPQLVFDTSEWDAPP